MRSDGTIEKKRKMVFPGTYDPFTKGHLNVVERAILLCDELVIAVFDNSHKTTVVPIEKRVEWIRKALADYPAVKVLAADGLLVHFCEKHGIDTIVRGVRGPV
ncbi:MAG: adenylyltransferase/cytidyltransferase family protein, partial [Eubacteriales bacterium]|nr:adenylyltransferase/cytidyltransferase family protein [Eubacteriales bacterium]